MSPRTVRVNLGERSYDVHVGAGILSRLGATVAEVLRPRAVLLVADDALPGPLVATAEASLRSVGLGVTTVAVHASEHDKSFAAAQRLVEAAAASRLERADAIIALGGGVIGDLGGFAASIYRRGVAFVQCPTTLLSMVDASVGGKTAVNLQIGGDAADAAGAPARLLKNMVGTFHQPRLVLADVDALRSLPQRHLRSGLAECIKHGMLGLDFDDPGLLDAVANAGPKVAAGQATDADLIDLIARNVALKARVVSGDEFERGSTGSAGEQAAAHAGRESLNLGHTFGHALEAMPHPSPDADPANAPLHHGEAVALGLIAATATAEALAQVAPGSSERVRTLVASVGLPTRVGSLRDGASIINAMMDDKKVQGGRLRLVLPWQQVGRVHVVHAPALRAVEAGLDALRSA